MEPEQQQEIPQADQARNKVNEREEKRNKRGKKISSLSSANRTRIYVLANDLASRVNLVEKITTKYNVLLPITSRGIGLACQVTYRWMVDEFPNRIPNIQGFSVEALYRVSMMMFEYKLYLTRRDIGTQTVNPHGYMPPIAALFDSRLLQIVESIGTFPAPIYSIIGSVGKFKHGEIDYSVFLPSLPSRTNATQLRADPFRIRLFNLHTVMASYNLATTPPEARAYFRRYCTIPGIEYNDDNLIANIDDICEFASATNAAVTQLNQDTFACLQAFTVLVSKFPNFLVPVKFTSEGSHMQLSNVFDGIIDIPPVTEDFQPLLYPGEVTVKNLATLKDVESLLGGYSYLGEFQPGPYSSEGYWHQRATENGVETARVNWTSVFRSLIGK